MLNVNLKKFKNLHKKMIETKSGLGTLASNIQDKKEVQSIGIWFRLDSVIAINAEPFPSCSSRLWSHKGSH